MRDWNKAAGLACMGEGRIIIMKQPEIMLLAKINWWMRLYFRLALCFMSDRSKYRDYFTRSDVPVISPGCSMPISWIRVGMMSHSAPPSRSL